MYDAQSKPRPSFDEAWLNRPIGLGLPTKRSSAFGVLRTSAAPTPSAFRAADRRQQTIYRDAVAPKTCTRCAAVVLVQATVCTFCGAPSASTVPVADYAPSTARTYDLSHVPTQRMDEEHSVPSVGPNPFLAAARMLQAREAAEAV